MGTENTGNTVDENGTITFAGDSVLTKGNHSGMPTRTDAYLSTDERGHIQASSLGGDNSRANVVPQDKELNHGAYYHMEAEERGILSNNGNVYSEKTAFVSNQAGGRPDAFIVNDTITFEDGKTQTVHLSFQNSSSELQDSWNTALMDHEDMLDAPNEGDQLREMFSPEEYAEIMDSTDQYLSTIKDDFSEQIYVDYSNRTDSNKAEASADTSKGMAPDLADGNSEKSDSSILGSEFADFGAIMDTGDLSESQEDTGEVSDTGGGDVSEGTDGGDSSSGDLM